MVWILLRFMVEAAFLRIILKLIAKDEADLSMVKLVMVVCGIIIGGLILNIMLLDHLPPNLRWLMIVADVVLAAVLITVFCWVSFAKSVVVTLLYSTVHVGFSLLLLHVMSNAMDPNQSPMRALVPSASKRPVAVSGSKPKRSTTKKTSDKPGMVSKMKGWFSREPGTSRRPKTKRRRARTNNTDLSAWQRARDEIVVSGIMALPQGRLEALVNGEIVGEGDIISVVYDRDTYRFRAKRIFRTRVEWEHIVDGPVATNAAPSAAGG